jgi:carboxylesterase type B
MVCLFDPILPHHPTKAPDPGLRDQQVLFKWIHHFISEFGGDPSNITLFGESTGAADILCHLHSSANQTRHLFHRAILQSPSVEFNVSDPRSAGASLARTLSGYNANTAEELRKLDLERLVAVRHTLRATDDDYFFRPHWREHMFGDPQHDGSIPDDPTTSIPLQPVIIGDCTMESSLWSFPVSYWNVAGVVRRIRAICQSMQRGNAVLRVYDISASTPEDELSERILDLINDARFAYPIDCVANALKRANGGKGVFRYIFDQESPTPGALPHHAADLVYLFDNVPLPSPISSPEISHSRSLTPDLSFSDEEDEDEDDSAFEREEIQWMTPVVDGYAYARVKNTIQERWLAFAHGKQPWNEEKAYVFGPEGETGERSWSIFEGRRRTQTWQQALVPLGLSLVQKLGEELGNGPQVGSKGSF